MESRAAWFLVLVVLALQHLTNQRQQQLIDRLTVANKALLARDEQQPAHVSTPSVVHSAVVRTRSSSSSLSQRSSASRWSDDFLADHNSRYSRVITRESIVDGDDITFDAANDDADERATLMALFEATGGATSWLVSTHWGEVNVSLCAWYGVTCDSGRLSTLSLPDNGLTGVLPAGFGTAPLSLPSLTYMDITSNSVSGSLPRLCDSPALRQLLIVANEFSGTIGDSFDCLPNLIWLAADQNQLSG